MSGRKNRFGIRTGSVWGRRSNSGTIVLLLLGAGLFGDAHFASAQIKAPATNFTVTIVSPAHGSIVIRPPVPADGKVPAGTVLSVKISPDRGYALDSGFYTGRAPWTPAYFEFFKSKFRVTTDQDREIGASFIEKKALKEFSVTRDVVYARQLLFPQFRRVHNRNARIPSSSFRAPVSLKSIHSRSSAFPKREPELSPLRFRLAIRYH